MRYCVRCGDGEENALEEIYSQMFRLPPRVCLNGEPHDFGKKVVKELNKSRGVERP